MLQPGTPIPLTEMSTRVTALNSSGAGGTVASHRKRGHKPGQIIIGALFSIHEMPTHNSSYTYECGQIREQYGMHRVEAFLKTIDDINADPRILPNISLGVDIRDTCWFAPVALEQSIDFIRNSLSHNRFRRQAGSVNQEQCENQEEKMPIAAVIGPASSTVTIQVQNVLQIFQIPQIGYSATSIDLSRKDDYPFYMRVVPSDTLQVETMLNVLVKYNWTYVSVIYSSGNYGSRGMQQFRSAITTTPVCMDNIREIDMKDSMESYRSLAKQVFTLESKAKVIVCFCEGKTVENLFRAMLQQNLTNRGYLLLGSEGWADRTDILGRMEDPRTKKYELSDAFVGHLSIRLHSPTVPGFKEHFRSLRPHLTPGPNPWFEEFWEQKFGCSLRPDQSSALKNGVSRKPCTGQESLMNADYTEDTKLGFVVNAAHTVARGLHMLHQQICGVGFVGICKSFLPINGRVLMNTLLNVTFTTYHNEVLYFDPQGDPPGRYDIMNYQARPNGLNISEYGYYKVGEWRDHVLIMNDTNDIHWPPVADRNQSKGKMPVSICSPPCTANQVKVLVTDRKCCWSCKTCDEYEFKITINGTEQCQLCPNGTKPNADRNECLDLPIDYVHWDEAISLGALAFSCIGILATMGVAAVFAHFNNTPVVKSSTRELMYIILCGIALSYSTSFILLPKPEMWNCILSRVFPGLSLSLIFGALCTKTNRIARILAGSKKKIMTRKPRFLSTTSQIVITVLINLLEGLIILGWLVYEPPAPTMNYNQRGRVLLICNTTPRGVLWPLVLDAVLIALCTLYAIRTRNLPENFNETKFIGFSLYTTCIIWMAMVPIYFGSDSKVISVCMAMNLTSTVCLVLLFCPKVYIMLLRPEKNNRSAFTTSKDIRCHIGPNVNSNTSTSVRMEKFQSTALQVYRQKSAFHKWRRQSTQSVFTATTLSVDEGSRGGANSSSSLRRQQQSGRPSPLPSDTAPMDKEVSIYLDGKVPQDLLHVTTHNDTVPRNKIHTDENTPQKLSINISTAAMVNTHPCVRNQTVEVEPLSIIAESPQAFCDQDCQTDTQLMMDFIEEHMFCQVRHRRQNSGTARENETDDSSRRPTSPSSISSVSSSLLSFRHPLDKMEPLMLRTPQTKESVPNHPPPAYVDLPRRFLPSKDFSSTGSSSSSAVFADHRQRPSTFSQEVSSPHKNMISPSSGSLFPQRSAKVFPSAQLPSPPQIAWPGSTQGTAQSLTSSTSITSTTLEPHDHSPLSVMEDSHRNSSLSLSKPSQTNEEQPSSSNNPRRRPRLHSSTNTVTLETDERHQSPGRAEAATPAGFAYVSIEDMSVLGLQLLDEEERTTEQFEHLLRDRGLTVDMDSIQTSDV